jgi:hypothetical protein
MYKNKSWTLVMCAHGGELSYVPDLRLMDLELRPWFEKKQLICRIELCSLTYASWTWNKGLGLRRSDSYANVMHDLHISILFFLLHMNPSPFAL